MITIIKKCISTLLIVSQFFWVTVASAQDLIRLDTKSRYVHETFGSIDYQTVTNYNGGYKLAFDDSIKQIDRPLALIDDVKGVIIGYLTSNPSGINVTLDSGHNVLVQQLMNNTAMQFSGGEITFDTDVTCPLTVNGKTVGFKRDILSNHALNLKAASLMLQNVAADSIQFVFDQWQNQNRLAAKGAIQLRGDSLHHLSGAEIIAGGEYRVTAKNHRDESTVHAANKVIMTTNHVFLGRSFDLLAAAFDIQTQTIDSELENIDWESVYKADADKRDELIDQLSDDLPGIIAVRDYFKIRSLSINDLHGFIHHNDTFSPVEVASTSLSEIFGVPFSPSTISFSKKGLVFQARDEILTDFNVKTSASIFLEAAKVDLLDGILMHGDGADHNLTILARERAIVAAHNLPGMLRIQSSDIDIHANQNEGPINEIVSGEIYLEGMGNDSSIKINSTLFTNGITVRNGGSVAFNEDIYGHEGCPRPDLDINAHRIDFFPREVDLGTLVLRAHDEISIPSVIGFDMDTGIIVSGKNINITGSNEALIFAEKGLFLVAPNKKVCVDVDSPHFETKGELLHLSGKFYLGSYKFHEKDKITDGAEIISDGAARVETGHYLATKPHSAKTSDIVCSSTARISSTFSSGRASITSGAGGTYVEKLIADIAQLTSDGKITVGSAQVGQLLHVKAAGAFTSDDVSADVISIEASAIRAQKLEAKIAGYLKATSEISVADVIAPNAEILALGPILLQRIRGEKAAIQSTESSVYVGNADGVQELNVTASNAAHVGLHNVATAVVVADDLSSVTGSANVVGQKAATTIADVTAGTLEQEASSYARASGNIGAAQITAPMATIAAGSEIGALHSKADNLFIDESHILQLFMDHGRLYTTGNTAIDATNLAITTLYNQGNLRFGESHLDLEFLLNGGVIEFDNATQMRVKKGLSNTGSIHGNGYLQAHLPNQFGLGNISVNKKSDGRTMVYQGVYGDAPTTFVEKEVGTTDNQCGFLALETTREEAVQKLLLNLENDHSRTIIGDELYRNLVEGDQAVTNIFFVDADIYLQDIQDYAAHVAHAEARYVTIRDDKESSPQDLEAAEAHKVAMNLRQEEAHQRLKKWCQQTDTLIKYITKVIGRSGHMLSIEQAFGSAPLGTMDVIAALKGFALEVFVAEGTDANGQPLLKRIHTFSPLEHGFDGEFKTRRVVLTSADAKHRNVLNHFNILQTPEEAKESPAHQANKGTLFIDVASTILPERLLMEHGIKADELVAWSLHGDQVFFKKTSVPQKTVINIDGNATIYGGFQVDHDFGLFASNITGKNSSLTGSASLSVEATVGNCALTDTHINLRNLILKAAHDIRLLRFNAAAEEKLSAVAGHDLFIESSKTRYGGGGNYYDVLQQSTLRADTIHLIAGNNYIDQGIETWSKLETFLNAGGSILHLALALESQRESYWKKGYSRDYYLRNVVSKNHSQGAFRSIAGDRQEIYAAQFDGKTTFFSAVNGIGQHAVHDIERHERQEKKKSGNFFGGSKTVSSGSASSISQGTRIKATDYVEMVTKAGDIVLEGIQITAPKTIFEATTGVVKLMAAENRYQSYHVEQSKGLFWQSVDAEKHDSTTYTPCSISGDVEVRAKELIVDEVKGKTLELMKRLEANGADIRTNLLREHHEIIEQSASGPTQALAVLIAVAVTIATYGTGSYYGAALASSAGATGTSAAFITGMTAGTFTTVCSSAAVALLNAKGDIGRAAKSLATEECIRNIVINAVTQGLTQGAFNALGWTGKAVTFADHFNRAATGAAVGTAVNAAAGNKGVDVKTILATAVATAAAANFSGNIGDMLKDGLEPLTHKLMHALVGAGFGAALAKINGGDVIDGATAGAMAAVIAETVAEVIAGDDPSLRESAAKWGKIAAPVVAFFCRQNVHIAGTAAASAVDNNFLAHSDKKDDEEEKKKRQKAKPGLLTRLWSSTSEFYDRWQELSPIVEQYNDAAERLGNKIYEDGLIALDQTLCLKQAAAIAIATAAGGPLAGIAVATSLGAGQYISDTYWPSDAGEHDLTWIANHIGRRIADNPGEFATGVAVAAAAQYALGRFKVFQNMLSPKVLVPLFAAKAASDYSDGTPGREIIADLGYHTLQGIAGAGISNAASRFFAAGLRPTPPRPMKMAQRVEPARLTDNAGNTPAVSTATPLLPVKPGTHTNPSTKIFIDDVSLDTVSTFMPTGLVTALSNFVSRFRPGELRYPLVKSTTPGSAITMDDTLAILSGHIGRTYGRIFAPQSRQNVYTRQTILTDRQYSSALGLSNPTFDPSILAFGCTGVCALHPYAGGSVRYFVTERPETFYRVFSGDNNVGSFLTKVRMPNALYAREYLALPSTNTAQYKQTVIVPAGTVIERSRALPAFSRPGGLEQFYIADRDQLRQVFFGKREHLSEPVLSGLFTTMYDVTSLPGVLLSALYSGTKTTAQQALHIYRMLKPEVRSGFNELRKSILPSQKPMEYISNKQEALRFANRLPRKEQEALFRRVYHEHFAIDEEAMGPILDKFIRDNKLSPLVANELKALGKISNHARASRLDPRELAEYRANPYVRGLTLRNTMEVSLPELPVPGPELETFMWRAHRFYKARLQTPWVQVVGDLQASQLAIRENLILNALRYWKTEHKLAMYELYQSSMPYARLVSRLVVNNEERFLEAVDSLQRIGLISGRPLKFTMPADRIEAMSMLEYLDHLLRGKSFDVTSVPVITLKVLQHIAKTQLGRHFVKPTGGERPARLMNCPKNESLVWNTLRPYHKQYRTDGKYIYRYDMTHNDIEVYDLRTKTELGSICPVTGRPLRNGNSSKILVLK